MKRMIIALLGMLGIGSSTATDRYEASTNFDLSNVPSFFECLNRELSVNLDVAALTQFVNQTAVEQERSTSVKVVFKGSSTILEIRVFMDDVDAPDIYFFTSDKALADAIDQQMEKFAEELGI